MCGFGSSMAEWTRAARLAVSRLAVCGLIAVGVCGSAEWVLAQQSGAAKQEAASKAAAVQARLKAGQAAAGARIEKDVQYAKVGDKALLLDLFVPPVKEGAPKPPLVVWVHGGGWKSGSKNFCPIVFLTEHGFAVASVGYRLTDSGCFPAQIHDCKGAVRWLRAHADKYGFDATKVGAAGASAGGHLVALLATTGDVKELEGDVGGCLEESSRVQAVVDFFGPSDLHAIAALKFGPIEDPKSMVGLLLGGKPSEKLDLAKLASPYHHVTKDDAPLLIVQGDQDPLVQPEQSKKLHAKYQEAGLDSTLEMVVGGKHGGAQFFDDSRRALMMKHLERLKPSDKASATAE